MNKKETSDIFQVGKRPTVEELEGEWQVKMWGKYWFMRWDRKVIKGSRGYNLFLCFKWGDFTVIQHEHTVWLRYDKGGVIDHLKKHPDKDDVMVGEYHKNGELDAVFTLTRVSAA